MLQLETLTVAIHVILGVIAVTMGAIALTTRKGAKTHVSVGKLFVVTMGASSVFGAVLGLVNYTTLYITFHGGVLGACLVVSGLLAVRIKAPDAARWFVLVAVINGFNALGLVFAGGYALTLPDARLFGFAAGDYLFLSGMATVAVICDLAFLLRKDITQRHRIAQHLWRMCLGFFIAAGSAFTGPGAKAFPEAVQTSGVLSLPELIIMVLMLFWLFKTLRTRQGRGQQFV